MNERKVHVIGSGPGGLSAAISLAQEGHAVTICEKNTKIGGKLLSTRYQFNHPTLEIALRELLNIPVTVRHLRGG